MKILFKLFFLLLKARSHILILFILFFKSSIFINAQEKEQDTTKLQVLDEVLVTAIRVHATSPITHSNVDKELLEKRNLGQDIPILLNFLPSIVTTSDAGAGIGYTGIRIRGINAQSTNVTINGIPYNDAESLGTFWVDLPDFSSSVENMQVQRGVGTSTNGSGAFGASINVLTDAISYNANAEISNSLGSFNTRKHTLKFSTGLLGTEEKNKGVEISGRLSQIKSEGYIDRATSDLKSFFLQAAYLDDNTLIKALTFSGKEITYQSWYGFDPVYVEAVGSNPNLEENRTYNIAGIMFDDNGNFEGYYNNQVDDYQQDHYQLHWNQSYNKNWSSNIGLNYTRGRGYFEEFIDNYYYSNILFSPDSTFDFLGLNPILVDGQLVESLDYVRRRWLDNDYYVANLGVSYKNNTLNINFGTSYSYYDGDHFGEVIWAQYTSNGDKDYRYYEGNGMKKDFNAFTKATYRLNEKWSLYGDLQLRTVGYKTTGLDPDRNPFNIDENYIFFNPKTGVSFNLNSKNNFYFSYARANREPNRDDFQNNPNVKPEQLNDFELGWRHQKEQFSFNVNAYLMYYNEQLALTGNIDNVGNPIRDNVGESYRLGLELEAFLKLNNKFSINPNLTLSTNKNVDMVASIDGELLELGKTNISFSPNVVAANALTYEPMNNLQFSFLSKFVGEQYMGNIDSEASKLESYFVNDLNVVYELTFKEQFIKSAVFTALINNIFNEKYVSNGYYYSYDDTWSAPNTITTIEGVGYYPQATTNFLVGLTLKF